METQIDRTNRIPVIAAYLAPFIGVPLLGPWVLHASVAEDSPTKPHIARAFDLHLVAAIGAALLWALFTLFIDFDAGVVVSGVFLVATVLASPVVLVAALRNSRWLERWGPVVLGRRKFYRQEPFVR